ncbi:protein ALP1-like [Anoplophora glabripennis]|uniref:protein ALP1-like n=1 Tax=Anoplophora glabripennis TaxID=217634 RepID=UPI000C7731C6|nr:protein ALP1-like [Anoplophora glabripennis]
MAPEMFDNLLHLVGPRLQKDRRGGSLSPDHRLAITLHYLAEGCSMQEIARGFRIGKATVHVIISETTQILWEILMPLVLPVPTTEMWRAIAGGFYRRWNIPNCVGAVDGKHIHIQAPNYSGSEFFNYKKGFSLVLMATCDAYYRFVLVDIGGAGSNHDSVVFQESGFGMAMFNGQLNLPNAQNLPNSTIKMEHFFVADQAFPLHKNIMRPYPGHQLGDAKNIFNYRLSRARRTIENTFGILVQRWRILRRPIIANIHLCENITKATIVIHNFIQRGEMDIPASESKYCGMGRRDYIDENGVLHAGTWNNVPCNLRSVGRLSSNNASQCSKEARNMLQEYFLSKEGCLPWQWEYVSRGSLPE